MEKTYYRSENLPSYADNEVVLLCDKCAQENNQYNVWEDGAGTDGWPCDLCGNK